MRGGTQLEEPRQVSARNFTSNFCHLGKIFSDSSAASGTIFYPCWTMSSSEDFAHFYLYQSNFLSSSHRTTAVYCRFKDYWQLQMLKRTHTYTILLNSSWRPHATCLLALFNAAFTSNSFLSVFHISVINCSSKCKLPFSPVLCCHPTNKLTLSLKQWLLKEVLCERF